MGFEDILYKQIERGTFEQFEEFYKDLLKVDPKYGDVFLYTLAVADAVSESYFKDQAILLGGFGVLGHMVNVEGPDVVKRWRGSHDLDLACQTPQGMEYLLRNFADEEHQSLSLPYKKTAKFHDPYIEEVVGRGSVCDADIYYPSKKRFPNRILVGNKEITPRDFEGADTVMVYGVPLKIFDKYGLLGMKLSVVTSENLPRPKDIIDVYNLLGVCERKGLDAETILSNLTDAERVKLMEIFQHANPGKNKYVIIQSTKAFLRDLTHFYVGEMSERDVL